MGAATKTAVRYEAFQDKADAETWRVEGIDYDNDGVVYVTLFLGPDAEKRAREYATFKNP